MTPRDFCYWLQGHTELSLAQTGPTEDQWASIKEHLALAYENCAVRNDGVLSPRTRPIVPPGRSWLNREPDYFVRWLHHELPGIQGLPTSQQWQSIVEQLTKLFRKVTPQMPRIVPEPVLMHERLCSMRLDPSETSPMIC